MNDHVPERKHLHNEERGGEGRSEERGKQRTHAHQRQSAALLLFKLQKNADAAAHASAELKRSPLAARRAAEQMCYKVPI